MVFVEEDWLSWLLNVETVLRVKRESNGREGVGRERRKRYMRIKVVGDIFGKDIRIKRKERDLGPGN